MTPDEAQVLHGMGAEIIMHFVAIVNKTFWFTAYSYLVVKAGKIFIHRRHRHSKGPVIIMSTITVMYTLVLIIFALDLAGFILGIKYTLLDKSNTSVSDKLNRAKETYFLFRNVGGILYAYLCVLGDAIIIWRVHVLMPPDKKWLALVPTVFLTGTFIATVMMTYCAIDLGNPFILHTFSHPDICVHAQVAACSTVFATTGVATALIGAATWHYRRTIKPVLADFEIEMGGKQQSPVESVLMLLFESGVLYFLVFTAQMIINSPQVHDWVLKNSGLYFVMTMYEYCVSIFVGIYPTAILVMSHATLTKAQGTASATSTVSTFRIAQMSSCTDSLKSNKTGSGDSKIRIGHCRTDSTSGESDLHSSSTLVPK